MGTGNDKKCERVEVRVEANFDVNASTHTPPFKLFSKNVT